MPIGTRHCDDLGRLWTLAIAVSWTLLYLSGCYLIEFAADIDIVQAGCPRVDLLSVCLQGFIEYVRYPPTEGNQDLRLMMP